jgi:hypothetical protein
MNSNAALLIQNGHPDLAIPMIQGELDRDPTNWQAHTNIGIAYRLTNQFLLALLHQKLATQIGADQAPAWHNLGVTQTEIGDFDAAYLCHRKAAELAPDNRQVLLALAYALMRYGKLDMAWPIWEAAREGIYHWPIEGLRPWDGEQDLQGKKILVVTEGGYGDSIFFLRWFPELQDRGAEVSFYTSKELAPILVGHPWISRILTNESVLNPQDFDYSVSLMSLPAVLKCTADKIPAAPKYIMAHPDKVQAMQEVLYIEQTRKYPLIGICWGAEEGDVVKRSRTIPDEYIYALKDAPVDWISLWPGHCLPWMNEIPLKDWSDTAALISHLDAVVSVDTAVMHLAAAMGKPTTAIVPIGSDWKFFRGVNPSPWYPSLEVITNDDPVKWTGAIEKVKIGLRRLHGLSDGGDSEHGDRSRGTTG